MNPMAIEFLNADLVEHTHYLARRVTPVQRVSDQPLFADIPEAGTPHGSDIATVLKGPDGVIRMWYRSKVPAPNMPLHGGRLRVGAWQLRYAESRDGLSWTFPKLGLKEVDGSRANNVVLNYAGWLGTKAPAESMPKPDLDAAGRPLDVICILDREVTPLPHTRGRYTALSDHGESLAYSDDGFVWTAYPENPVLHLAGSDTYNHLIYDAAIELM